MGAMGTSELVFGGILAVLGGLLLWATGNLPSQQLGFAPWFPTWIPRTAAGHQVSPVRILATGFLVVGLAWLVLGISH
jgi:hypothetical protein